MKQQPPHDFSRPPRSIKKHRKYWKASEFRTWLLYYSLPLLLDVLPALYIHHHALLVCAMHILLQDKLQEVQIQVAEEMLAVYYELLKELYGEVNCTLNSHLLIHLSKYVRLWGPLWTHSAFGFESFNGFLTSMVHSKFKLGDQLLFSINVSDTLTVMKGKLEGTETDETLEYLSVNDNHQRSNMSELLPGVYSVGNFSSSLSPEESLVLAPIFGSHLQEVRCFYRLYSNNSIYHSAQYGKEDSKRNSTICCYRNNGMEKFGVIQKFVSSPDKYFAFIKPFNTAARSLLARIGNPNRPILQIYADANLLGNFIIPVEKDLLPLCLVPIPNLICKCVLVKQNDIDYVSKIPNSFEHH